jgi:hypothetical protein
MALTQCPECKKEISDAALVCPGCGVRIERNWWGVGGPSGGVHSQGQGEAVLKMILVIVVVILAVWIFSMLGGSGD